MTHCWQSLNLITSAGIKCLLYMESVVRDSSNAHFIHEFKQTVRIYICMICCSGLNFLDLMVRQGTIDNPPKPPLVPGFECSGIVESVGENTKGFEVSEVTGGSCGHLHQQH